MVLAGRFPVGGAKAASSGHPPGDKLDRGGAVTDGEKLFVCLVEVLAEVGQVLGCGECAMTERDFDLPDLMGVSSLDRKQHLALRPTARLLEEALHLSAEAGDDRTGAGVIEGRGRDHLCVGERRLQIAR